MVLFLPYLLSTLALAALYPAAGSVSARRADRKHVQALQRQAADKFNKNKPAVLYTGGGDVKFGGGVKNFTFLNPTASGERLLCGCLDPLYFVGGCSDCGVGSVLRRWKYHTGRRLGCRAQLGGVITDQRERERDPKGKLSIPLLPFRRRV